MFGCFVNYFTAKNLFIMEFINSEAILIRNSKKTKNSSFTIFLLDNLSLANLECEFKFPELTKHHFFMWLAISSTENLTIILFVFFIHHFNLSIMQVFVILNFALYFLIQFLCIQLHHS
jgi:hypothetical protein